MNTFRHTSSVLQSSTGGSDQSSIGLAARNLEDGKYPGLSRSGNTVSIMGIELQRGLGGEGTPPLSLLDRTYRTLEDLKILQWVAVAFKLDFIPCIEGGAGYGKSTAVQVIGALTNTRVIPIVGADLQERDLYGGVAPLRKEGHLADKEQDFGFIPAGVTEAMQNGGIVFLDEFNALNPKLRYGLRIIMDAIIDHSRTIMFSADRTQAPYELEFHPDFKIVLAQNDPNISNNLTDLNEADYSRVLYMRLPNDISDEMFLARDRGAEGYEINTAVKPGDLLEIKERIDEKLNSGIDENEYETASKAMLEFFKKFREMTEKEIGADQGQPMHVVFSRDQGKVRSLAKAIYTNSAEEAPPSWLATVERSLEYIFVNRVSSDEDREKIRSAIQEIFKPFQNAPVRRNIPNAPDERPDPTLIGAASQIALMKVGERLTMGRSGTDCDLQIDDPRASRVHLRIDKTKKGEYIIQDLNSTNGTLLDGTEIGKNVPITAVKGQRLTIGETNITLP
jgi:MoxR-like ATPase